ncbi:hypothetical protein L6V77_35275, partial [Myxococcota bacterium]|nr:hypothetical protein [Myxococcota bacterium]
GAVEPGAVDVRIEGTFSVGPVAPPVPENVPAGDGDGCGFLGATDFRATVEDASGVALRYMPAEGPCAAGRYVLEVAVPGGRDRAVLRVTLDLVERDPATGAERIVERVVQTVEVDLSAGAPVVQVQVVATGGERCGPDGVDDDADGLTDCDDAECFEVCRDEDCGNGVEDDNDRLIDCADPECAGQPACRGVEVCDQQGDEDGDGVDGCRDPDCARHPFCAARVERLCGDQLDDDGDFLVDCADPDCAGQCGSVDISWQLRRNGQVIDCADVEGNTVFFGFAGPNAEIIRPTTADCNTTPTRVQLLAGQYTLGLRLESIGGVELSVAAPIDVPVVAGNHLPLPTFILDIAAPDACGTPVVIDSIYPSGAIDDGMAWERDFVVLHNRRPAPYDLAGHGLLFIPPGGDPRRIDLSGVIPASSAYLIAIGPRQFVDANLPALGYLGFPLPEPDLAIQVEQQIDLFAQAAYVLVSSPGVPPAGSSCPFPGQLDAFAPAGNACSEGFGFFGGPGTDSAITRVDACVDTDVNGQDFAMQVIDAEHPIRNSASPARACACP